jgi:acyl-coenzyme A synthetase/AMP-(fatty) acid ligase/acyl carrier protein
MRSAGARLASSEREALETAFAAPLLDGYGLTEAPQSVLNLLPPFPRKSGSVGVSIGPALAVVDESGAELPLGRVGEIVLRGPTVFAGYLEDESANERAFLPGGWFRTGDLGYLDPDGYLFLTGRLKEIINRGGEKVSPFEVEEILCSHPEVAQAIVFPLPDARLGEEVAAFIVPGAGAASRLSERELRSFASASLPPFKVPRRIIIGVELPVGPLGKVRRLDLARQLELTGALAPTASDDETCTWSAESVIARIAAVWGELLATAPTRSIDDFFTLGGDSILAARVAARIQVAFGVDLAAADLFSHPSLAEFTDLVETRRGLAAPRHVDEDADDRSS